VLFVRRGTTWLLQWLIVSAVLTSAAAPAWNSLLRDLIPMGRLGRVFALRTMLGNGLALPAMLAGGYMVDWWSARWPGAELYAYSSLFLLGLGFGLAGVVTIARLPEPTMMSGGGGGLLDLLAEPFRDRNYRRFLVFVATWGTAVNLATPFFATYMLQRLGLPVSTVTTLAVTAQVANLLFLSLWGRLADRFSNKAVIATCAPLYLLAFAAWAFTATPQPHAFTMALLVSIHVASGVATAGIGLPIGNLGLKLSPPGLAHAYVTLAGVTGALSGTIAPLIGGALADFFAARELTLRLAWAEPTRHFEFYALRLEALDFLFLLAAAVGVYGLSRLARVEETGDVTERTVMEEAFDQVVLPFRTMSTVEGIRRLTFFPLSAIERLRSPRGDHGGRGA
jgi:MFS family permease